MQKPYVVGIDIGGTNTVFGIVDARGSVLATSSIKTQKHVFLEDYIKELYQELSKLIKDNTDISKIKGIGIGAPNANYFTGNIEQAPNLPWKGIIPFAKKINEKFEENSFDRVVSFGNTLVHLDSREEVEEFFQKVYKTLKFNGFFIVQIINYNRIIEKNIKNLPTIDNEKVKFVRDYEYDKSIGKVDFITELTIKEANLNIKNNIKLLALTKIEIQKFLGEIGFRNIEFYGDFEGRELSDNSEAVIFVAQK